VLLAADASPVESLPDLLYAHAEALQEGEAGCPGAQLAFGKTWQRQSTQAGSVHPYLVRRMMASMVYYHLVASGTQSTVSDPECHSAQTFSRYSCFQNMGTGYTSPVMTSVEKCLQLPLDAQGHIDFPGGPDVWRVSRAAANGSRPVGSLRQPSSAAEEDEILLPLLAARHNRNTQQSPLVEAFLGLVRLQRHRHQPMDEPLAALLLQKHSQYQHLFPYLASLPELTISEIALLFEAAKHLEGLDSSQLNLAVGEFHSLIQFLIVLSGNNALRDGDAARLFAELCRGFWHAKTDADFAAHSCEMVLKIGSALQKPSIHHGGGVLIGSNGDDRSTSGTDLVFSDVEDILFRSGPVPQKGVCGDAPG
jgi:hypothetical protein